MSELDTTDVHKAAFEASQPVVDELTANLRLAAGDDFRRNTIRALIAAGWRPGVQS